MNYTVVKVGDDAVGGIMPILPQAEGTLRIGVVT
jgi:hypothetical protein